MEYYFCNAWVRQRLLVVVMSKELDVWIVTLQPTALNFDEYAAILRSQKELAHRGLRGA